VLLMLSLLCTPLYTVFKLKQALKVRRALGLYTFLYAGIHFLLFVGVDYQFNLEFILADTGKKPFAWVGLAALLILLALAATSFQWAMRRLGKNWKRLHRLVYLAGVLVVIHFAWAKKANLFTLSGDVWQPLLFIILASLLLVLRIPGVRRRLAT
jgi:methionine sulfoxide reductase heme-binding subunit